MTSSERAQHAAEIVKSALERPEEDARLFLDEACAGDAEMRAEVDSLLKFQAQANGFIEQGALNIAAESLARDGSLAGEQVIGGYKILSKIGAGGMGDVYLAEDIQLRRKVALKLVRAAMSTDDIVARFRHEEQILASLNDPNIAHLYGGGVTANGIPFFAMEYIEGLRIDQYCDRSGLNIGERLQLFRKVCSAVHYAHQHLVIHRDLKPSNILVTEAGEPKLLDFGIAKLLKTDEAAPAVTLVGVMTPDYASPEQVRGDSITTASDVYSLGVIFYELLTGHGPYRVKNRNPAEIARAITDQAPERPSTAITKSDIPNPQSVIRHPKFLKGDLDNIALMALRKDPARRYASVAQFSEDIRRHLDGRPVIARKDTFTYRASRFIARNKVGVAAAVLVFLAVIVGLTGSIWEARVAANERDQARHQRTKAEKRFNDVRHLAHSFLFEIYPQIEKLHGAAGARETLVKRALEYLDSLAQEAGDDYSLQYELGAAYFQVGKIQGKPFQPNLGDAEGALGSFRKAEAIFENILRSNPRNAIVQQDLGYTYQYLGNLLGEAGDKPKDLASQRKAVAVFESLTASDPENAEYRLNLVRGYNYLATAALDCALADQNLHLFQQALEIHRQAIATAEALVKRDPTNRELLRQLASTYQRIGYTLRLLDDFTGDLANYPNALDNDSKAAAIFDDLSASEPTNILFRRHTGDARLSLGHSLLGLGRARAALETFGQALATFETLVAVDPLDMQARHDLADTDRAMAEALAATPGSKGALEYVGRALELYHSLNVTYPGRVSLILTYEIKAEILARAGDEDGAIGSYREALALLESRMAAEPTDKSAWRNSAIDYRNVGRLYAIQAATSSAMEERKLQSWAEARAFYQCSLEAWEYLQAKGCLRASDEHRYAELLQEITKCDTATARP